MHEYEVTLLSGVKTTLQLDDGDVKNYPGAKRIGRAAEAGREVAADASAAKRSRGGSKETR